MKKHHTFKLLSKTTFIYLIFTFIAFFSSAFFLTREADEFIYNYLERRFKRVEDRIQRHIEADKPPGEASSSAKVSLLADIPPADTYPVYSDTLIYSAEADEMQYYRQKTTILIVNGDHYKAVITKPVDDFLKLRDDIFGSLIPAFILLAGGIVLFNYLLSGYFFRPFNKILGLMKTYSVGQKTNIEKIETSTVEFKKMQDLFHQMIERIEYDYRHLKEYTENMSHEIQTPLTVIRNKTENLIADESVMQRHSETVKAIYDETNHLTKLGNTLNLLTRIENGEFNNAIDIASRPIIEKHVGAVSELAALKSLSIETALADEHRLLIDPFLLDIVLKNLLRNAISYGTPEGPIRIQTTAETLSISNYGPALDIPEEKLFERFYRNHQQQTSLGLGLSLVKKICELNDLRIEYRYREGQHIFTIQPDPASSNRETSILNTIMTQHKGN
jgi:signal transduction histidine kinase